MKPIHFLASSLVVCALISGCGNDENEVDLGNKDNFPIINPGPPVGPTPQPPLPNAPVVTLDSGTLAVARGGAAVAFSPGAVVTDADNSNFNGGVLTIRAGSAGNNQGLILNAPATAGVTGNGSGTITVALNENSTPNNVRDFLRAVTITANNTANFGSNQIVVDLSDGTGLNAATVTRNISVGGAAAQNFTVGQGGLATLQSAIDAVAATDNAQGSTITVPAGNFAEIASISNDPDLAGLIISGPNSGLSAGVTPETRGAEAIFTRIDVDSARVVIQGITISEGATVPLNESAGIFLRQNAADFTVRDTRFVRTAAPGSFRGLINSVGATNLNTRVEDSLFQGFATGVFLQGSAPATPTTGHRLQGNAFMLNTVGVSFDNAQNVQVTGNGFRDQTLEQMGLFNPGSNVVASGNKFDDSSSISVFTGTPADTASLDARNNFWGGPGGPATVGNNPRVNEFGTGTFNVQTDPFLTTDPFPGF